MKYSNCCNELMKPDSDFCKCGEHCGPIKSDLDRAKELRDEMIINNGLLRNTDNSINFLNIKSKIKQEAKKLKEKVEKGCRSWIKDGEVCGNPKNINDYQRYNCQECQETLKLLEEILK